MSGFSGKEKLDNLLINMVKSVQLDETRKNRMESSYQAIEDVLNNDDAFFKNLQFEVYPQGSVKIGTTVKPIANNEFDLDIVVHIANNSNISSPSKLYNELKRVFQENETYKAMIKSKNRCIQLDYAGDFHMDILPGVQDGFSDIDKLLIPDKKLGGWVSSNPRGYASWFLNEANKVIVTAMEAALAREKLPSDDMQKKKPLQLAVQLIKIYRDKYFENNQDMATSSIILTTIAGILYNGENSIYDTIENIVSKIHDNILSSHGRIRILNPVNIDEDFTDKWDQKPELYKYFKKFIVHLHQEWNKLKKENGIQVDQVILEGLFSKRIVTAGMNNIKGKSLLASPVIAKGLSFPDKPVKPNKPDGFA